MSDNVSRQAVLSILNGFEVMDGHTDQQRAIHMVELLPSTDRTGKWLKNKHWSSERWEVDYKCSECGYITVFTPKYVPFCPNCGADMRGADDESTI